MAQCFISIHSEEQISSPISGLSFMKGDQRRGGIRAMEAQEEDHVFTGFFKPPQTLSLETVSTSSALPLWAFPLKTPGRQSGNMA
jgi:hypothetical protein